MSFDYPSGQGSKSASRDYPNLHDLTEALAVELGVLPDQLAPCQFEAAQDGHASYVIWGHLLLHLFW